MNLDTIINENYKKLNTNDFHILHFVQLNTKLCSGLSISELALKCNVSPASILRTAKKLNFSGYSEFKYFLKSTSSNISIQHNMLHSSEELIQDIQQTMKFFKQNSTADTIYKLMYNAKTLYAYGTGYGQRLMLNEFARCLLNMNRNLVIIPAFTELGIVSKNLQENDLLFIVSLSGNMDSLKETIINLEIKNIPIVSLTNFNNNELASFTKYNFYFQSSNINKENNLNQSSFLTLHLLLHLIYEGYVEYFSKNP